MQNSIPLFEPVNSVLCNLICAKPGHPHQLRSGQGKTTDWAPLPDHLTVKPFFFFNVMSGGNRLVMQACAFRGFKMTHHNNNIWPWDKAGQLEANGDTEPQSFSHLLNHVCPLSLVIVMCRVLCCLYPCYIALVSAAWPKGIK